MRSKILAPLAVVAVALTASSTSSAQQAPSSEQGASASASFSTSGAAASSSGPSGEYDAKRMILPFVIGGLGAAQLVTGVVLVAAAPSMPDNCSEGTRTCTRLPGQSDASFKQNQKDAGDSQQMNSWGLIGIGSGAVFLVAGAAMYLWYNRDEAKTASSKPLVMPYASSSGGGVAAVATF